MSDRNPSRASNWKLVCKECGAEFHPKETMETVRRHFVELHNTEKPTLELKWIGKGPAPASRPKFN